MNEGVQPAGLRAQRKARTEAEIVEAVLTLLEKEHPTEISMPRIAEASGVSLRTLYRYFPTKADLIDETSKWMNKLARPDSDTYAEVDPHDLAGLLDRQWTDFGRHLGGIRAQHLSAAGRDIRKHRLGPSRQEAGRVLDQLQFELSDDDRARLIDASIAVSSSSMYLELADRMAHDDSDAAELAAWMVEAFLAHAERTGSTRPRNRRNSEAAEQEPT